METEFTPFASLLGGGIIGLSAVVLLATQGRIAGISGIVSRILPPSVDKAGLPRDHISDWSAARGTALVCLNWSCACSNGFKQWVAISHRWFAGRVWCGHGEWLHKRPWRMRYLARISAVDCCNHDIYGHCLCDCFCFATCPGGLRTCVYSAHSLQVFCLGWDLFCLEWRTPQKFRTSLICLAHGIPALLS